MAMDEDVTLFPNHVRIHLEPGMRLKELMNEVQRKIINQAMFDAKHHRPTVAKRLGIKESTLRMKMRVLGFYRPCGHLQYVLRKDSHEQVCGL